MLYDYDIRKILRRYSPVWFRWPANLSFAYSLCRRLVTLDVWFGSLRDDVAKEWRYNGLMHSLEWALNDKFDNVLRRIEVRVFAHPMYIYYSSVEQPSFQQFAAAGDPYNYNFLSAEQLSGALAYRSEFEIRVPDTIGVSAKALFDFADLYRLAGSRPQITWIGFLFSYPTFYDQYDG